ncbi:transposase [Streptomyces mirabilis]|uniref:transposase n=1 Tax=Streptomyces mirabilis TaxID=68239 RepID=UPI000D1B2CBD
MGRACAAEARRTSGAAHLGGPSRPFLPVSSGRCGRWWDHRQVIDGILHLVRTGVQWCDLHPRFGRGSRSTNATGYGRPTAPGNACPSRS